MPTPARTSVDEIVAVGRTILESEGIEGLTMQRVAAAVGIRAPSLYKRVRDRSDLVRLILTDAVSELTARLDETAVTGDPRRDLAGLAHVYREFARSHPETYALLFSRLPEGSRIDAALNTRASQAVVRTAGALAGSDDALDAARTFVAWANGFIGMELAGAFRLGGDVDRAFEYGIDRIGAAVDVRGGG